MNSIIISEIAEKLSNQAIKFGACTVEVVFHDGKITHYILNTAVRYNAESVLKGDRNETNKRN